ncbi:AAA family ATPase [Rhodococcus erythropolis]|uniref:AAA family ATPase n=1 Tax=Rhodococcus erythropolis TaxID=1833 RepID=UPI0024BB0685|nr:AAA family ATPase [Rhodococcus erythropolis]MDJ0403027.1 AAA family ATPase [Rhodococcus erythropolis]
MTSGGISTAWRPESKRATCFRSTKPEWHPPATSQTSPEATQAGAVVPLLGDPLQLASVESGGVLRDLAERTDAPFLSKIHRFKTVGEAAASLQLRDGDESALTWYQKEDRIREAMKHELPNKVFAAYVADVEEER